MNKTGELGVWKVAPMAVHNLIDIAAGAFLAASPWTFGFADETANCGFRMSSSASPRSSSA
jgi:SPW repeat